MTAAMLALAALAAALVPARAEGQTYEGVSQTQSCPNGYDAVRAFVPGTFEPQNCSTAAEASIDGRVLAASELTSPRAPAPLTGAVPAVDSYVASADAMVLRTVSLTAPVSTYTFSVTVHVEEASSTVTGDAPEVNTLVFSWAAIAGEVVRHSSCDCEIVTPDRNSNSGLTASYGSYTDTPLTITDEIRTATFTVRNRHGGAIPAGTMVFGAGLRTFAYDQSNGRWGYNNVASSTANGTVLSIVGQEG